MTADPTRWRHAEPCSFDRWRRGRQRAVNAGAHDYGEPEPSCSCGLSAFREAVASGDPLAVLDVVGMGGTLEVAGVFCDDESFITPDDLMDGDDVLYRVVRPLPDAPEVSP